MLSIMCREGYMWKRVGGAVVARLIQMDELARSLSGEFTGFDPDYEGASGGKLPMGMPASDDASDERRIRY